MEVFMNLYPYLTQEVDYVWAFFYLLILALGGIGLLLGSVWLMRKLLFYHRREQLVKEIRKAARIKPDEDFLKLAGGTLFKLTAKRLGESPFPYPCEAWLESLLSPSQSIAQSPFRKILDACIRPSGSRQVITAKDKQYIEEEVVKLIRKWYV